MSKLVVLLSMLLCLPAFANAHEMVSSGGFAAGLMHPVLGFDHFLAMISVGILSARIGGRAAWSVPLTFVCVMAAGAVLGAKGISIPPVELGISLSVVALGVALAADRKLTSTLVMCFVGFFAIFHGHAHGSEMPALAEPLVYAAGFVIGTATIHILGVCVGIYSRRNEMSSSFIRYVGAGIAGVGIHLLYIPGLVMVEQLRSGM